jgi:hypothetical protein
MFRFTENNEGIFKPVCFVIDFAPKKGKEEKGALLFSKHTAFCFWLHGFVCTLWPNKTIKGAPSVGGFEVWFLSW